VPPSVQRDASSAEQVAQHKRPATLAAKWQKKLERRNQESTGQGSMLRRTSMQRRRSPSITATKSFRMPLVFSPEKKELNAIIFMRFYKIKRVGF
jgi:hypothetical protein